MLHRTTKSYTSRPPVPGARLPLWRAAPASGTLAQRNHHVLLTGYGGVMALLQSTENLGYERKIFSPEHDAYRATARRFFKKEIEPFVKEWQNDVFFPAE